MLVLQLQLQKLGVAIPNVNDEDLIGSDRNGLAFVYDSLNPESLIQRFRALWTEMGDFLSRQYAGTNSTISKVSRDGAEGFIG